MRITAAVAGEREAPAAAEENGGSGIISRGEVDEERGRRKDGQRGGGMENGEPDPRSGGRSRRRRRARARGLKRSV